MEVTLKRAAELARAAGDAAAKVKPQAIAMVSIHVADRRAAIAAATARFGQDRDTALALLEVQYKIRGQIGAANAQSGINQAMTEREMLEALDKRITALLDAADPQADEAMPGDLSDPETAEARLAALKERFASNTNQLRAAESIRVLVASPQQADELRNRRAEVRNKKANLNDKIAGLNLNTRIVLDATTVDLLKAARIV